MDYMNLIGSIGFPIVMCLLLYKQQNDTVIAHKEEMKELRTAIDNNTLIITKLVDRMEVDEP